MKAIRVMAWVFSMLSVGGCGGAAADAAAPMTGPSTTGDQTAVGAKLYEENCASCHGSGGEGTAKVPAV